MKDTEVDGRALNVDISHGKSTPGGGPRGGAGGDRRDNKVSEPSATLFVGNLSFETSQDGLYELFGNSGCQSVRLPTDRETGQPKGYKQSLQRLILTSIDLPMSSSQISRPHSLH